MMGTMRSRFLRTFPSGAFDLKASLGFERWSGGVLGRGADGMPLALPSQMYLETLVELRIQSFAVYFSRANLLSEVPGYVPGFPVTAAGHHLRDPLGVPELAESWRSILHPCSHLRDRATAPAPRAGPSLPARSPLDAIFPRFPTNGGRACRTA